MSVNSQKEHIRQRLVGESELVSIDFGRRRPPGTTQTILSVIWTPESPVTMVSGSDTIGTAEDGITNCAAQARFTTPSPGLYTVYATATMQNPTEVKIDFVILDVRAIPT